MHLTLFLLLLIPSALSLVLNLTTINGSLVEEAGFSPAHWLPSCANAGYPLTWAAPISAFACAGAINLLRQAVVRLGDKDRTIFSRQSVPSPRPGAWGLPSGFSNCKLSPGKQTMRLSSLRFSLNILLIK